MTVKIGIGIGIAIVVVTVIVPSVTCQILAGYARPPSAAPGRGGPLRGTPHGLAVATLLRISTNRVPPSNVAPNVGGASTPRFPS